MIPWRATYRLQLTPTFAFPEVERLLPYFARLGISHLYLSPILEARSGSAHGYDGIDPRRVRREFGGEDAFRNLARVAHEFDLGLLVDIVPNHLAVSAEGEPFLDVLEKGIESRFARWFDVDWTSGPHPGRIAIPWIDPGRARNYRRYLDIDDLIGIRVEDPVVFEETHAKILELAKDGLIDGVRVDHLDGLARPAEYLERLKGGLPKDVAIFVETTEDYSEFGVTGYDALAAITMSRLSPDDRIAMTREFEKISGAPVGPLEPLAAIARVIDHELEAEYQAIASRLRDDFTGSDDDLKRSLAFEVLGSPHARRRDAAFRSVIDTPEGGRFLRYVRAKAIEDTFYYRNVHLLARNELGASADATDPPWAAIRVLCDRRSMRSPSLTPTSTHDTKRSEDARARLVALSRHAERFRAIVESERAAFIERGGEIDVASAWYVLQEWIAIRPHPMTAESRRDAARRLEVVVVKAAREAKLRSTWANPDEAHEAMLRRFVLQISRDARLVDPEGGADADPLEELARSVADEAVHDSLAQVLLKFLIPGIPDLYQGMEAIRPLLVDPDNRIPVDFARLEASLDSLDRDEHLPRSKRLARVFAEGDAGRLKHFVTRELLRFRAENADFLQSAKSGVRVVGTTWTGASPAMILRRHDVNREILAVFALDSLDRLAKLPPLVLPAVERVARREWFTERVFDATAQVSLAELLSPLGFALLVAE